MTAIYNELDRRAAQWTRNLIAGGHVAPGVVDERSIASLAPADVAGPGQRHFFAGIAGWSYALRLAGVADDADVWTGSCPCQPFSAAGRRGGVADERHLWPEWFRLIRECRPATILGEQVASTAGLGWLDAVFADLEGAGYACAAADLCAASVGAPHIRQRLYFVAYAHESRPQRRFVGRDGADQRIAWQGGMAGGLAYPDSVNRGLYLSPRQPAGSNAEAERRGEAGGLGDAEEIGRRSRRSIEASRHARELGGSRAHDWSACEWIQCSDGKQRPVEPGTHPLAHGVSGRVELLRGYGNAIVPQVAAAFITAALGAA